MRAVLVKSPERFERFKEKLTEREIDCTVLDTSDPGWTDFDFSGTDILIWFPSFAYSSNSPLAVADVRDFVSHVHATWPEVQIFPDPHTVAYYNDKFRQYLFFKARGYPIPETIPLISGRAVELAEKTFGYPMVVKNRHGAGGGAVFKVNNRRELQKYFKMSRLDLFNVDSLRHYLRMLGRRSFYYHLVKDRKMIYPFFSAPLLAQRFVRTDRDVRVVVGYGKVVEAHWRITAAPGEWKVNIDGGGIGEWSAIPTEVTDLCLSVARALDAGWIAFDVLKSDVGYLFTEFSPVWHHYTYNEKPTFVYKDDYNVDVPLDVALDLERIIVDSLVAKAGRREA